jgi:hypothetical protein
LFLDDQIKAFLEDDSDLTLTLNAKLQIVLAMEKTLRDTSELIDTVKNYTQYINSEKLQRMYFKT